MLQLQENKLFANRYFLIKQLGSGAFSEVWKAQDTMADNLLVAIKIYAPDKGLDEDGVRIFSHEYSLVFNFAHQNLLRPNHFDVWEGSPFLVLPYCQRGSSMKLIGKMDEREVAKFLHDVSSGLAFLHEQNPPIIHQDIKPDNILIMGNGHYTLTDFGISTRIRSTLRRSVNNTDNAGTMAYMAPERFERNPSPIMASDIWSLGATVFELMTGDAPFGNLGGVSLKSGAEIPEIQGEYSEALKQLIESCLSKEPCERPTAEQLKDFAEKLIKKENANIKYDSSTKPQNDRRTQPITPNEPLNKTKKKQENNNNERQYMLISTEISKFNWGAFGLYPIWGFFNGMWWLIFLILLIYIPIVGPIICFVLQIMLGIKGSKWSWNNKNWSSYFEFVRVQKAWKPWGIVFFILSNIISFLTFYAYGLN